MARAGVGEYDSADGFYTRTHLQHLFLHRAAQLVPELKPSLVRVVETLPEDRFEELKYPDPLTTGFTDPEWFDNETARVFDENVARMEALERSIRPWQEEWRLVDEWVSHWVREGLTLDPSLPGYPDVISVEDRVEIAWISFVPIEDDSPAHSLSHLTFPSGRKILSVHDPQPDDFEFSSRWYPLLESRSDISRLLKEQFDRELNSYLDATEAKMEASGLARTPEKRPRRGGGPNAALRLAYPLPTPTVDSPAYRGTCRCRSENRGLRVPVSRKTDRSHQAFTPLTPQ